MSFARDIADRICFLDAGVILEHGPPAKILSEPSEARTHQFLQRIIEATPVTLGEMQEPGTRGIDLSLEPLDDFVVIQPSDEESETNLGLIIPASAETDCRTGVVTAVGSEAGGVEPGDKVVFPSDAGYEVRLAGNAVRVMRRGELIARVHD
jgi:co-chaperonin GroES (HSP10)